MIGKLDSNETVVFEYEYTVPASATEVQVGGAVDVLRQLPLLLEVQHLLPFVRRHRRNDPLLVLIHDPHPRRQRIRWLYYSNNGSQTPNLQRILSVTQGQHAKTCVDETLRSINQPSSKICAPGSNNTFQNMSPGGLIILSE